MKLDSIFKFSDSWKEIFVGFVSTVLGIAVTIGVDKKMEEAQAEEDKRNLTIMIIHDLDISERQMKETVDFYRSYYEQADYVSKHLDQVSVISEDTIAAALKFLTIDMELSRLKFPQMAENVLTTNMSNWTTLSNVKFMSNAESCFANRRRFNEVIVPKDISKPAFEKYAECFDKYQDQVVDWNEVRKLVSSIYVTSEVRRYISNFEWVISEQSRIVAMMHELNSENKWLMSVSSDDIQAYVKASSQRAPADRPRVTKESILGTWQADVEHEKGVRRYRKSESLTFNADNTYRIERMADASQTSVDTVYTHTETAYGHWSLEGNDLRRVFDSVRMTPVAQYADDQQLREYLAELQADFENDTTSDVLVMSDILIGDTDLSSVIYSEDRKDETRLVHYVRK